MWFSKYPNRQGAKSAKSPLATTHLKVLWEARVSSIALLACVGVDEEGFREVWR